MSTLPFTSKCSVLVACLLLVSSAGTSLFAAPPSSGSWELTFEDHFDGMVLDGSKWKIAGHWGGIGGQGGNDPEAITVSDGTLKITASTDSVLWGQTTYDYSTAEISTFRRFKQRYGYFEGRMRYPAVRGLWPAFWTMPDRENYGNPYRHNRAFLKFDLSSASLPAVSSAQLQLKISGFDPAVLPTGKVRNFFVFPMADDSWSEANITWNNQPIWNPLFIKQFNGVIGAPSDVIFIDVTNYVGAEMQGDGVVSFALADTLLSAHATLFYSSEATNAADRPQLIINGVPYEVTEDAHVNLGNPSSKQGSSTELNVGDYWGNTAVTSNGGMEIDIMEGLGVWGPNRGSHALHWDGYNGSTSVNSTGWGYPLNDTNEFNVYGAYWEPGLIEFYVNGERTGTFRDSRVIDVASYLLLSLQIGGWDGNQNVNSDIDGESFEIDWIRVWSGTRDAEFGEHTEGEADGTILFGNDFYSYGSQGIKGSTTISTNRKSIRLEGNSWVKFPIVYDVTPDTVLEFTLEGSDLGEVLGIGLDENNQEADTKRVFQLGGSQAWSNTWQDYRSYTVGSGAVKYEIPIGAFYIGSMQSLGFVADDDGSPSIDVTFSDVRVYEDSVVTVTDIEIGELGQGVAATDWRGGSGYLMYSATDTSTRFNAFAGTAAYIVAVYYNGGQWYADGNYGQVAFAPESSDVLLAEITFGSAATVSSLVGGSGLEYGIQRGYTSGDLTYQANAWIGGGENPAGDFVVEGTSFTVTSGLPFSLPKGDIDLRPVNSGVAATSTRYNSGYLMYSRSDVGSRFNTRPGNAAHVVATVYTEGQWHYDTGNELVAFTPRPDDILLAAVDFREDSLSLFEGLIGTRHGVRVGYASGDIVFSADTWGGVFEDGQFGLIGSVFRLKFSPIELYNQWSLGVDWLDTPIDSRCVFGDAEKDGMINFLEFALGMDPLSPSSGNVLEIALEENGDNQMLHTVTYPKPIVALNYQLQYSRDLKIWDDADFSAETWDSLTKTAFRELETGALEQSIFFRLSFPEMVTD